MDKQGAKLMAELKHELGFRGSVRRHDTAAEVRWQALLAQQEPVKFDAAFIQYEEYVLVTLCWLVLRLLNASLTNAIKDEMFCRVVRTWTQKVSLTLGDSKGLCFSPVWLNRSVFFIYCICCHCRSVLRMWQFLYDALFYETFVSYLLSVSCSETERYFLQKVAPCTRGDTPHPVLPVCPHLLHYRQDGESIWNSIHTTVQENKTHFLPE